MGDARKIHRMLDHKAPNAEKEKHHGNKRRLIQRMKVAARRQERHDFAQQMLRNMKEED